MNEKYDVVIIGAGIGGLVCGCYLAKAGLKVLIVEQQDKPGGYCTSFEREGYRFDVGVHYLGSLKKGVLRKIFDELQIDLKVTQSDPSDKIIMPDNITYIRNNIEDTIKGLKESFTKESENINNFFKFILRNDFLFIYRKVKKYTFSQVLNEFFQDDRLKATINLLLGNIGLSANIANAVHSIAFFRQYILDCGHYPIGGMQAFPDKLVEKIKSYGGNIIFLRKVTKIICEGKVKTVVLSNKEEIVTDIVVSNADATETFKQLLNIKTKEYNTVDNLKVSPSLFIVYLGLNVDLEEILKERSNIWYFSAYNVDNIYSEACENIDENNIKFIQCSFPSMHDATLKNKKKSTVLLFTYAPYNSEKFWDNHKDAFGEKMIAKASEIISDLKSYIQIKFYATPVTFYKYTSNRDGSFVGWLSTLEQMKSSLLPQKTSVDKLYIVGHWCTKGYAGHAGIPNVALSGRQGAMLVLSDLGKRYSFPMIKL